MVYVPALCQWGSPTLSDQSKLLLAHHLNRRVLELLPDLKNCIFILSKDGLEISAMHRFGPVPTYR